MTELSLEDFVGRCSLTSISQLELSGTRSLVTDDSSGAELVDPAYGLDIDLRDADDGFRIRLTTRVEAPQGTIVSQVGAEYVVEALSIRSVSRVILVEFVNNVALMHILPYTRQSISDISVRVFGSPLLMPIIQRGELSFSGVDE